MTTRDEALKYGLSLDNAYQNAPFHDENWQIVRFKGNDKAFLWTYERDGKICINVKARQDRLLYWRDQYEAVSAGYHQNKQHWNTVVLDGTVPDDVIKLMIDESYRLISDSPTQRIYEAVKLIPKGKVATYAQIAEIAGNPKMCRAVGNALHKNPDPEHIPCYRVVNSKGELSGSFAFGGADRQKELLEADGVEICGNQVNLVKYQWKYVNTNENYVEY